ncbi:hypothetical protein Clacol_010017 [Clathrus columnatus]|uniref:SET domain-containing protein n=1 Tax=Clathrus columnatus TaxID=1419009 RepID=A0AAV5ARH0_9AGAM|nr:hypothetical protein Clacol_010017 [Clathrus columnatus]
MPNSPRKRKSQKPATISPLTAAAVNPNPPNPPPPISNFKSQLRSATYRLIIIIIITVFTQRYRSDVKTFHDQVIPYEVVDLPGKGKGMVAIRHIQQGERIITEKPLLIIPQELREDPIQHIDNKITSLSQEQKYEFFNLSHAHTDIPHDQIPISIIQTNGIAAGPKQLGVFPRASRMNHGCSSAFNAVYSWRENENILVVHALRNISQGEEILTVYFDTKQSRERRREHLLEQYKFQCTCKVCSLPPEASIASDMCLQQITNLKQQLTSWESNKISGKEAVDIVRSIWRLSEEEGYWSERGQWAADAVHVAAAHSDEDAVRQWGLLAQEWFGYELGQDSNSVTNMHPIVENPRRSPTWGTRERLNVGGPEL